MDYCHLALTYDFEWKMTLQYASELCIYHAKQVIPYEVFRFEIQTPAAGRTYTIMFVCFLPQDSS